MDKAQNIIQCETNQHRKQKKTQIKSNTERVNGSRGQNDDAYGIYKWGRGRWHAVRDDDDRFEA